MKINILFRKALRFLTLLFLVFIGCKKDNNERGRTLMGESFSSVDYALVRDDLGSASAIRETLDGGYIIVGGASMGDVYILKTDKDFNEIWLKTYGGFANENVVDVRVVPGGYVFFGETRSFGEGQNDFYLVKVNDSGEHEWTQTYGTELYEQGRGFELTSDGGFLLVGFSGEIAPWDKDMFIVKIDEDGRELWSKRINKSDNDEGLAIVKTDDDNFIVSYSSQSQENALVKELNIIKINKDGEVLWDESISKQADGFTIYTYISKTSDNGVILAFTEANENFEGFHINLVKTNSSGTAEWSKNIDIGNSSQGYMAIETNGGYAIIGSTQDIGNGFTDVYFAKTDKSGNILWENTYGGRGYDLFTYLTETQEGDFVFCGTTTSSRDSRDFKMAIVKTNATGIPE